MSKLSADIIANSVIDALKEERVRQGISHEKLAEKAGLHRSAVSLIESKKRNPTLKNCLKLAQALNIDLYQLLKDAS